VPVAGIGAGRQAEGIEQDEMALVHKSGFGCRLGRVWRQPAAESSYAV
jgi:hypothetical protein